MRVEDCYQLGFIAKTHGLKGEVQLHLDVDFPEEYKELESMFVLRDNTLVPFFLESLHLNGNKALIKIEEIDSKGDAQSLVSKEVYLPLNQLPSLEEGQYYFHELVGCTFYDDQKALGEVKNVITLSPQPLLEIDFKGTEILVPVSEEIVLQVDTNSKKIVGRLPEGLLDIYLNEDDED